MKQTLMVFFSLTPQEKRDFWRLTALTQLPLIIFSIFSVGIYWQEGATLCIKLPALISVFIIDLFFFVPMGLIAYVTLRARRFVELPDFWETSYAGSALLLGVVSGIIANFIVPPHAIPQSIFNLGVCAILGICAVLSPWAALCEASLVSLVLAVVKKMSKDVSLVLSSGMMWAALILLYVTGELIQAIYSVWIVYQSMATMDIFPHLFFALATMAVRASISMIFGWVYCRHGFSSLMLANLAYLWTISLLKVSVLFF